MGVPVDMGLVVFVSSGLSAGAGAFIGSYLMKKGENLATHEDINKLVDQVKSVTQATKEIEAKKYLANCGIGRDIGKPNEMLY